MILPKRVLTGTDSGVAQDVDIRHVHDRPYEGRSFRGYNCPCQWYYIQQKTQDRVVESVIKLVLSVRNGSDLLGLLSLCGGSVLKWGCGIRGSIHRQRISVLAQPLDELKRKPRAEKTDESHNLCVRMAGIPVCRFDGDLLFDKFTAFLKDEMAPRRLYSAPGQRLDKHSLGV